MDCVMIDRISYESMKLECEQLKMRNNELERDCELFRGELQLIRKLNDVLENIKFNLEKSLQLIRSQFNLAETQYEREVLIWQEEYQNIKCMITQMAFISGSNGGNAVVHHHSMHDSNANNSVADNNAVVINTGAGDGGGGGAGEELAISEDIWDNSAANDSNNEMASDEMFTDNSQIVDCKTGIARRKPGIKRAKVYTTDGEKRFKCTWSGCSYGTDNRGNFQKHYRIHTGEKPYKCAHEGCCYCCSDPARFREHKLIHSSEKTYVCEWPGCTWKFKTHKLLKNHIKACHTGDKPHKCEWPGCDKQFLNKYEVRDHMRQHTGDRPYKCEYPGCNGAFARSNTLTQHIREVHYYKKQYFCDYADCDERFDAVNDLKSHVRERHPKVIAASSVVDIVGNEVTAKVNIDLNALSRMNAKKLT